MARVLIFCGSGHYADPWHPFAETSQAVAEVVTGLGHHAVVRNSEPGALLDLREFDLLVVNSGGRTQRPDVAVTAQWAADHSAVMDHHESGVPILGLHTAVGTFPDWDGWSSIIGGSWTADSFHPELGLATFHPAIGATTHPIWAGLETVSVIDERYSFLKCADGSLPVVQHTTDEAVHTMGWVAGASVIYDGLGHDGRSYESEERRRLLENEVQWLLTRGDGSGGLELNA